jgi:hypothetical protein
MTTSNILSQLGSPGVSTGFKNRIINGAMVIDQRNAGASVTATGSNYCLDRWQMLASVTSKFTVQQNAGSVTPPVGFSNYLGVTSSAATSLGATDYYLITQKIEGFNTSDLAWGTANGKTITVSFQVYSSLTGTFGFVLRNSAGSSLYPASYTISTANTWTSVSVTVSAPPNGTTWIGATNGIGIELDFGLGVGSTYSNTAGTWTTGGLGVTGATSIVGTNGATFYITGVQLEVGTSATNFEYRDYGREFIMCQRYYETSYPVGYAAGYNFNETYPFSTSQPVALNLIASDDQTTSQSVRLVVQKRTSPTIVIYSAYNGASGNTLTYKGTGATGVNLSASITYSTQNLWNINQQLSAINQANESYFHFTASAEL